MDDGFKGDCVSTQLNKFAHHIDIHCACNNELNESPAFPLGSKN